MNVNAQNVSLFQRVLSLFLSLSPAVQMVLVVLALGSQVLLALFQVSHYQQSGIDALVDSQQTRAYMVVMQS